MHAINICVRGLGSYPKLARHAGVQRVVGIEGRQPSIDRAQFVKWVLGISNVNFVRTNLERLNLSHLGRFDVVFCVGVLYHMPEPWKLVEQIARVSNGIFLWTH
jgi:2-polyprenyl-3-methyl-5-hydroxy-6-metoxy-1,4-benzoquinol methylase